MQLLWENFQFVIILKEGLDSRTYAHARTHTHTPMKAHGQWTTPQRSTGPLEKVAWSRTTMWAFDT